MRDSDNCCDELMGITMNSVPEHMEQTSLLQEVCECVDVSKSRVGEAFAKKATAADLTDYFSRPVGIAAAALDSVVGREFNLNLVHLADILPRWKNGLIRMTGVYGFRATLVFNIQISATPFHQGLVALCWQYNNTNNTFDRGGTASACTNIPHVRLDLSEATMATLRVPYLGVQEYTLIHPSPTIRENYGVLSLTNILTPDYGVGGTKPHYRILVHLEDIELFGAYPQDTTNITYQSGKVSKTSAEQLSAGSDLSLAAKSAAKTLTFLGKGIPAISSFTGMASWFLNATSGALAAFGFSKPIVTKCPTRITTIPGIMEHNVDVESTATVVAPFVTSALEYTPELANTNVDEMALKYVLSQYNQINRFRINATASAGFFTYAIPVTPYAFFYRGNSTGGISGTVPPIAAGTERAIMPSNLFYICQLFRCWRGSIKFRFTFSKTKMHAGRIMVAYCPDAEGFDIAIHKGSTKIPVCGTIGADPFSLSAIYDLKDTNNFEFVVPYISPSPFTPFCSGIGGLAMYIVDPLLAPSMVANYIDVLVEVAAGDDFEVGDYNSLFYPPDPFANIAYQSGEIVQYTMGEKFNSLKQIIQMPSQLYATFKSDLLIRYPPWYWFHATPQVTPNPSVLPTSSYALGGAIAAMYSFCKGGTDINIYAGDNVTLNTFEIPLDWGVQQGAATNFSIFGEETAIVRSYGRDLHLRLPAHQYQVRLDPSAYNTYTLGNFTDATSWQPTFSAQPNLYGSRLAGTGVTVTVNMAVSASDDAYCGMFIGPPPVMLLAATGTRSMPVPIPSPPPPTRTSVDRSHIDTIHTNELYDAALTRQPVSLRRSMDNPVVRESLAGSRRNLSLSGESAGAVGTQLQQ